MTKMIPLKSILTVPNFNGTCCRMPKTNVLIASAPRPLTTIRRIPIAAINVPMTAKNNCFATFGLIILYLSFYELNHCFSLYD